MRRDAHNRVTFVECATGNKIKVNAATAREILRHKVNQGDSPMYMTEEAFADATADAKLEAKVAEAAKAPARKKASPTT